MQPSLQQLASAPSAPLRDLDQHAFSALAEPHRRALHTHCYRMLGCVQEAEELTQETLWRAWQRRETYAGRAPVRAWLYKIAINLCLNTLKQRPRRSLPSARQAAGTLDEPIPASIMEPIWLEPYPDDLLAPDDADPAARIAQRESVTLAFMTSLHLLPPRQRAILILRDVLDWPAGEVAELLDQSVPAVKSALHRARATLAAHYQTGRIEERTWPALDERRRGQLEQYIQAWEMADVEGLTALLKADATFSMPPIPAWYQGRASIGQLVAATIFAGPARGRWRLLPTRASGQVGFGLYRRDDATGVYGAYGIQVVTFDSNAIADITTIRNPALAAFFGLPATLEGGYPLAPV